MYLSKYQLEYDEVITELKFAYPFVFSKKHSLISNLRDQKQIKNIKPLKKEDEGTVFTYNKSNILNVRQNNTTELKEHTSPIEEICVLDNGAIVSCCQNLLCIWKKGQKEFALAKK